MNESQMPNVRGEQSTLLTTSATLFGAIKQSERSGSATNGSESAPFTGNSSSTQTIVAFGSSAAEIDSSNQSTHLTSVTMNYTNHTVVGVTTPSSVVNFSLTSFFPNSSYSTPFNTSSGIVTVWTSPSTPTVQTKMEEVGF